MKTAVITFPCKLTNDHSPECVNKIIYKGDYKINFQGCEHCFEKHNFQELKVYEKVQSHETEDL